MKTHVGDAELLLWLDGELEPARARQVLEHVSACAMCAERRAALSEGWSQFVAAREGGLVALPDAQLPADRLRARLESLPTTQPAKPWLLPAVALAAAMTIAGFWWLAAGGDHPLKPDARLTPGATLGLSREEVCAVPEPQEGARLVPASLAGQVFTSYGIRPTPRRYEVDYLIAPELGGATDLRNLWPQPYAQGVWNAGVKDALENHLRQLVCAGTIDLPTAQHEIAADWIAAYRKYFRTERPLAAHAGYRKDRPWE